MFTTRLISPTYVLDTRDAGKACGEQKHMDAVYKEDQEKRGGKLPPIDEVA